MKIHTLFSLLAFTAIVSSAFGENPATTIDVQPIQASGKAIITINVNGKTETREIELGNTKSDPKATGSTIVLPPNAEPPKPAAPVMKTWLGVAADELSEELRAQLPITEGAGLLVRSVVPESPAAVAGLVKNDVLVKLDDQILINVAQLSALVSSRKEGDLVHITYFRRGSESVVEAKLMKHEEPSPAAAADRIKILFSDKGAHAADGDGNVTTFNLPPLSFSRMMVMDKDGKIVSMPGLKNLEAAMAKVEKALRDAGVDDKAIEETKKSLQKTADEVKKGIGSINGGSIVEVEKAVRESARAMENAIRAAKPEPGANAGDTTPEAGKPATTAPPVTEEKAN